MTTMKRFDEALLDFENAIIERSMAGSSPYFARYHDKCMAARLALVEYVRERMGERALAEMTCDERLEVLGRYCHSCGCDDPGCQCWNDE